MIKNRVKSKEAIIKS